MKSSSARRGLSLGILLIVAAVASVAGRAAWAEDFDWRTVGGQNWLTPVTSQFGGTCWAFAGIGSLETKYKLTRNDPVFNPDLSEQNLVSETNPDMGSMDGGWPDWDYFVSHGVVSEAELPAYGNTSPLWPLSPGWENRVWKAASNTGWLTATTANMKSQLKTTGPLFVTCDAGNDLYTSVADLYANLRGPVTSMNHAVVLVGFHDDASLSCGGYWIIKNSWGYSASFDGYYYVPYGNLEIHGGVHSLPTVYYSGAMASVTWKGTSNGTWNTQTGTNLNWSNGGAPYTWVNQETQATFDATTANRTISIDGTAIAHGLSFNASGYAISSGSLTVTAGGIAAGQDVTINSAVTVGAPQTWTVSAGKTLTVGGDLHTIVSDLTIAGSGNTTLAGGIDGGGYLNSMGAAPGNIIKSGTGVLTLSGPANYSGKITASAGTLTFAQPAGVTGTFSGVISGSAPITKSEQGTAILSGTNNYSGTVTISSGALQADYGVGWSSGSFLSLAGGVLQSNGAVTFSRSLGASGAGKFRWTSSGGGFAAGAGPMTIRVNNGTGTLDWGTAAGSQIVGTLKFGSLSAANVVTFENGIRLNGSRTIQVEDNTNTSADYAIISGAISNGSGTSGLIKTGPGLLVLAGGNSYTGPTGVLDGSLQADSGAGLSPDSLLVLAGGVLQNNTATTFTRSLGTTSGYVQWSTAGGGFSAGTTTFSVNIGGGTPLTWGTASGSQLVGPLMLNCAASASVVTFQNDIDLANGDREVRVGDNPLVSTDYAIISGAVGGNGSLTKTGPGLLRLTGAGNTFSGALIVAEGEVELAKSSGLAASGDLTLGGSSTAVVSVKGDGQIAPSATLGFTGTAGSQTLKLLGRNLAVAGLVGSSTQGVIENAETENGYAAVTLTVNNAGGGEFNGTLRDRASGTSGTLALVKDGIGALSLGGPNIGYTGGTNILGGKLVLRDATNASFLSKIIANAGTLELSAVSADFSFSGAISGNGILAKTGERTVTLATSQGFSGPTVISEGALQANSGAGLPTASALTLDGGVLQGSGTAVFARTLGLGDGEFSWSAGGGGFSAGSGPMTVRVNNTTDTLAWGDSVGSQIVGTLRFGSLSAANVTTWLNGIDLNGASRTIDVTDNPSSNADFAVLANVVGNTGNEAGIVKTGTGGLVLTAANSYDGATVIRGGALQADIGVGIPRASFLSLEGGVVESIGATTFTRPLGTSGDAFQWTAAGGGFSAGAGAMTVNVGGGAALVWGDAVGSQIVGPLRLSSATATNVVTFQNNIDLGGAERTIDVADNAASAADLAVMSGEISGTGSVVKAGAGTLRWTGPGNTYDGATTVTGGSLELDKSSGLAIPGNLVLAATTGTAEVRLVGNNQLSPTATVAFGGTGASRLVLLSHATTVAGISDAAGLGVIENTQSESGYASTGALTINADADCLFSGTTRNSGGSSTGKLLLLKTGNGTLILVGGDIGHTGATGVSGGKLVLRNTTNTGFLASPLTNSASLEFNLVGVDETLTGTMTGAGSFEKTGDGALTIVGNAASYSGDMTVSEGRLVLRNTSNAIFLGSRLTNNAVLEFKTDGTDMNFRGVVGGAGTVLKTGSRTLTLSGSTANAIAGDMDVSDGTLILSKSAGPALSGNLNLSASSGVTETRIMAANQLAATCKINFFGGGSSPHFELLGQAVTVAGISDTYGTGIIENTWNQAGYNNGALIVNNTADCSFNGYIRDRESGSGQLILVKNGTGTLTLVGSNISYTGSTTINGGKLVLQDTSNATFLTRGIINRGTLEFSNGGAINFSGAMGGTGSLRKVGAGTLTLSGMTTNSYTGDTNVVEGALVLAKTSATAIPGNLNLYAAAGSTFTLVNGENQIAPSCVITFGGGYWPHFELVGHNVTVAGISDAYGTGVIENTQDQTGVGNSTLVVNNTADCAYTGYLRNTAGGSGLLSLQKGGTGTLTLTGGNTGSYTGGLVVNGGMLNYGGGALPACDYTITGGNLYIGALSKTIKALQITGGTVSGTGILTAGVAFIDLQGGVVSARLGGTNVGVNKTGSATAILSASNSYGGVTTISGGALQADSGVGLPGSKLLKLDGGVLQSDSTLVFSRSLGSNSLQWTTNGGGFSAGAGAMVVRLGGGTSTVNWLNSSGSNIAGVLKLSSPTAANVVDFQNGIALNNADRTIQVDDNPATSADWAVISGPITDTGAAGIVKTGDGLLRLTGSLTYNGVTTVKGGTLELGENGWAPVLIGAGGADIQAGKLVFGYTDSSPAATIEALLKSSHDTSEYVTGRIRDSAIASTPGTALGWTDDVGSRQVTVTPAFWGDTDLNGGVTSADLFALLASYNEVGNWSKGDSDYDGRVTSADLFRLLSHYNISEPLSQGMNVTTVPEPSSIAILALGLVCLAGCRWRRLRITGR